VDTFLKIAASRWTRLVLVLFFVLALQTTLFAQLRPFGVAGQMMLLFTACAGVTYGITIGTITGLVAGLMYDLTLATPLGIGSLALGVVGATAGIYLYFFPTPIWWLRIFAIAVASALGEIYFPIAQAMVGLDGWIQFRIIKVIAVVVVVNTLFAPGMLVVSRWALSERKART
jgi:rod shape-determining protein MreD